MALPRLSKGSIEHKLEVGRGMKETHEAYRGYSTLDFWRMGSSIFNCQINTKEGETILLGTEASGQSLTPFAAQKLENIDAYMEHVDIKERGADGWTITGDLYVFGKLPDKK